MPSCWPVEVDPVVSARMRITRGRDTKPELLVRRVLHANGRRYRVNVRPVASLCRTGDIVFTRHRVVVLIDGCFWHGCPEHFVIPKTRTDWWVGKIEGNKTRDRETTQAWRDAGWTVLRFWEHEPVDEVVDAIEAALGQREASQSESEQPIRD